MKKKNFENQLEQLKAVYIKRGFKQLLIRVFNYILEHFIAIGYTYKIDLDKIEYIPKNIGLTFKKMSIEDWNLIYQHHKDEIDERLYLNLLEKLKDPSCDGFKMQKYNETCGYCFISYRTTYPKLKVDYVDINNNGYLFNGYVFKKYRRQGIHKLEIYNRLKILKENNFKTATGLVSKYNYPAIYSMEKIGFKKCVICYFFRFGKWIRSKDHFKIIKNYKKS